MDSMLEEDYCDKCTMILAYGSETEELFKNRETIHPYVKRNIIVVKSK